MTVFTHTATERAPVTGITQSKIGPGVKTRFATQELAAAESGSTITFFKIPSNARIMAASRLYLDDLATSGSPTIDIGLFPVNGNITGDDDALNDGVSLSAATNAPSGAHVVKDFINAQKRAWEYVSGQTSDPGGELLVKATTKDASTTATGSVACELLYCVD